MRRRRRSAVSPWNVDALRSTTLRGIRSARSGLGQEFPLLCPTPKVMPRFSLGDVGEARWPLSHRWTDTCPILPDATHDSRNQGRVVSLSVVSLISACVGLCQLREVLTAESLVTDAQHSNRRVTCLMHIISDVTRVRHAQGTALSILRAFIACAAAVQTGVLVLFGPSCLGHYRPLQRRSASDKCSVRLRPIKHRQKLPQLFDQTLPSMKYIFAFFSKIYRKYRHRDNF